jgi:hypothetical protein
MTGDPALIWLVGLAAGWTYDLAVAAGPAADGIILASRRRLLRPLPHRRLVKHAQRDGRRAAEHHR